MRVLPAVLLIALAARDVRAGDRPVAGFEGAVEAVAEGHALPELALGDDAVPRLRAVANDPEAPERERAVAFALLGERAPDAVAQLVDRTLAEARSDHAASRFHAVPPVWTFLSPGALTAEAGPRLAWLSLGRRDPLALAALSQVPGADARRATLAFVSSRGGTIDDARLHSLHLRASRLPDEHEALLVAARTRAPLDVVRAELLIALSPHEVEGVGPAVHETLAAATDSAEAPSRAVVALVQALTGNLRGYGIPAGTAPRRDLGESLARLVERRPELVAELQYALQRTEAPVSKALLWSLVESREHEDALAATRLLLPRLTADDEDALLEALDPSAADSWFWVRLQLVTDGPVVLLTPKVHEALWHITSVVDWNEGRGGPGITWTRTVTALARFEDPEDTERFDQVLGSGPVEALREVVRRSDRPLETFLALLDDEDPGRREAAENALLIDAQSRPQIPIPRTIETWRTIVEVLQRRILETGDLGRRLSRLRALLVTMSPGPLSPMQHRTPEDERALIAFYQRVLDELEPTPSARDVIAISLGWVTQPEALPLLERLAKDEDERVAKRAREALDRR